MSFQANHPNVIHETYDDEVVIVNLESGNYYSLLRAGADIWNLLVQGATPQQTIAQIQAGYQGDRAAIERAVNDLIAELEREGLIVPIDSVNASLNWEWKKPRTDFEPPALEKYSDMQELLLLDPIHEVDEAGWPSRPVSPPTE